MPFERLKNRGMLTVDRKKLYTLLFNRLHHQFPCCDQSLLVGQSNVLTRLYRGHGRNQPRSADNCRNHHVGFRVGRTSDQTFYPGDNLRSLWPDHFTQLGSVIWRHNGYKFRMTDINLLDKEFEIIPGGERFDLESIWMSRDDVKRIDTDRSGRTEYCQSLHYNCGPINRARQ